MIDNLLNVPLELKVVPVFPTPVSIVTLDDKSLNDLLIYDIDKERERKKSGMGTFNGNNSAWLSEYGLEKKYASFNKLREYIETAIIPVLGNVGFSNEYIEKNIIIDSLWANVIFKNGGWAQPHIHGMGDDFFTGVYYPRGIIEDDSDIIKATSVTVQASGALVLSDPAKNIKRQVKSRDSTEPQAYPYYGAHIYIEPRESLLILFPSWIEHYVTPVVDDNIRYSISFSVHKAEGKGVNTNAN